MQNLNAKTTFLTQTFLGCKIQKVLTEPGFVDHCRGDERVEPAREEW